MTSLLLHRTTMNKKPIANNLTCLQVEKCEQVNDCKEGFQNARDC